MEAGVRLPSPPRSKSPQGKDSGGATRQRWKLICEVQNCGFDFAKQYGALGEGYAQVHHLLPLGKSPKDGRETKLNDLALNVIRPQNQVPGREQDFTHSRVLRQFGVHGFYH